MKFSIKIKDLEVRSCDESLLQSGEHTTAEIIRWVADNTCYTLARWKEDEEGFDLHFVGNRPLEVDKDIFWNLIKMGQSLLEEEKENA